MASKRFSWEPFSKKVLKALAKDDTRYFGAGITGPLEFLQQNACPPSEPWVGVRRDVLCDAWLPTYRGTEDIVDRLIDAGIGPTSRRPASRAGCVDWIRRARSSRTLTRTLRDALLHFGDEGSSNTGLNDEWVPSFAALRPVEQEVDSRTPHPYQQAGWERLNAELGASDVSGRFRGLLVMPTGSGKTFTAARWLIEAVINRGGRVLWLAHRHELLAQAAAEFHRLAVRANVEKLRVRIVSGVFCAATQIDPADHIVVASIHSLARRTDVFDDFVGPDTFVVIDEAHHAPAKTYRDLVKRLDGRKRSALLGLTATPTRTAESERSVLTTLFEKVVFKVEVGPLIEQGFLARPIPVTVGTGLDAEANVSRDDLTHIARFNDLTEEWKKRLASWEARNSIIVQHYVDNEAKYGRTIVFALNVAHAALLADLFRARGVRADYVASHSPDGHARPQRIGIEEFRRGEVDVLINVQMLTEGVDVPNAKTVFLTRPTMSEILMRQMVGRGMRGPKSNGTDICYLVSFEDHWDRFTQWADPWALLPDLFVELPPPLPPAPKKGTVTDLVDVLPWALLQEFARAVRRPGSGTIDVFEAVPCGWFLIDMDGDEDTSGQRHLFVYEHQMTCWDALGLALIDTHEDWYNVFFSDCDVPRPPEGDVLAFVTYLCECGEAPPFVPFAQRSASDPCAVAARIYKQDLRHSETETLVTAVHAAERLARAVYPELLMYKDAVYDALDELKNPGRARRVKSIPVFAPLPNNPLSPGPHHDLQALFSQMLTGAEPILGFRPSDEVELRWTKRMIKNKFGEAMIDDREIVLNKLLDSSDVSADTLVFLLWHELLHIHLRAGHTQEFRRLERMWPGVLDADRELDNLSRSFDITYW